MRITFGFRFLPLWALLLLLPAGASGAPSDPLLLAAARSADRTVLQELVTSGSDVNAREADGATALHWMAHWDDEVSVELLLSSGADPNAQNDLGATPLWLAALNGSAAMVDLLLVAGADPNLSLRHGETPLMVASRSGNVDVVSALLESGAEVDSRGPRGQTPLMWAAGEGHAEVVRLLVEAGADVQARSEVWRMYMAQPPAPHPQHRGWFEHGGNTALMLAARIGNPESVGYLLQGGADANSQNAFGITPLTMASFANFGILIAEPSFGGGGPFQLGGRARYATGDFVSVIAKLLDRGADPNLGAGRFTALHAAVMHRSEEVVELLLNHGANPNLKLGSWTPLHRGSNTEYYFHRAWVGASPIWLAARFSTPSILKRLIEAGGDPDYTHRGEHYFGGPGGELSELRAEVSTPLMAAVGMSRPGRPWVHEDRASPEFEDEVLEKVKILVAAGADPGARDPDGRSALEGAREQEYERVAEFLQSQTRASSGM